MNLKNVEKVLFLDIETVPQYEKFSEAPEIVQELFLKRFKYAHEKILDSHLEVAGNGSVDTASDETSVNEELWNQKASLYPEFAKIVCISVGMIYNGKFVKRSYASDNENELLTQFVSGKLIDKLNDLSGGTIFCAYNGEGFHFPFIAKRLIINGVMVPKVLFYPNLKPWERNFLVDLKTIWKWDSYEPAVSFKLLAYSLGLSNTDEIDATMIKDIYYSEKDLKKISTHCENDVELLYNAYIKLYANSANA
jgi:hypothetical protein